MLLTENHVQALLQTSPSPGQEPGQTHEQGLQPHAQEHPSQQGSKTGLCTLRLHKNIIKLPVGKIYLFETKTRSTFFSFFPELFALNSFI